jgi:ABC-type amino acid transport system permease subunit
MAEAQVQHDAAPAPAVESRSRWDDFRRVFFSNRLALFGTAVMGLFILMAVFAPLIAPYDPLQQDLAGKFAPPSRAHLMGQDELGRDILSRVIYGARISLTAGLAAVTVATVVGTLVGLGAGYLGRWPDSLLMRVMDVLLAFPSILLAIVIVYILGPSLLNAMFAISIVFIPQIARVVRSAVISVRERDYIEAERALGVGDVRIIAPRRAGYPDSRDRDPGHRVPLLPRPRGPRTHPRVGRDVDGCLPQRVWCLRRGPARHHLPRYRDSPRRSLRKLRRRRPARRHGPPPQKIAVDSLSCE